MKYRLFCVFFLLFPSICFGDNLIGKKLYCKCLDDWKINYVPQNDYCQTEIDKELQLKEIFFQFKKDHVLFHFIKRNDDKVIVSKKKLTKAKRSSLYISWNDKKDLYEIQRQNLKLYVWINNKKYKERSYYKCSIMNEQESISKKLNIISNILQDILDVKMSKNKI